MCPHSAMIQAARAAHARRDWPAACELFRQARTGELDADDYYAWSDAAWWLGDNDTVFAACERAWQLYVDSGRARRAAMAALDIAAAHFLAGDESVASGWVSRASRHLEGEAEAAEHGYLIYLLEVDGRMGGIAPDDAESVGGVVMDAARRVREIGRRHDDRTLHAAGLVGEGRVLVRIGRVAEGLALLDEALLAVLADDLIPAWTGNIYCNLIAAAEELGDLRRARDWTDAMTRWLTSMPAAAVFSGICRVHRSRVQQMQGAWDEAEREAARVCMELGRLYVSAAARAHHQVGDIRRLRGDLAGAEQAYRQAHALGRDPQPGLALLRLAQGRTAVAASSIRTALIAERSPFIRATLLAAQVEIDLAAGDVEHAITAAAELDSIAGVYGSSGLQVAARHAQGAILLAQRRPHEALPVLREACRTWSEIEAPYDCARVRMLLAACYRLLGDDDAAVREHAAAVAAFERLGAVTDMARAAAFDASAAPPGGLTRREAEVLTLVASGRTNKSIGRHLGLSERTVARHLANIFAKLGVCSRTAAAAFAFESGLAEPGSDPPPPR